MKVKVITLRVAIILTIISGITMFLTYFCNSTERVLEFIFSISSGVFTGTIVSVFIYIAEYTNEKSIVLENYYIASIVHLKNFINLRYYNDDNEKDKIDVILEQYLLLGEVSNKDIDSEYGKIYFFWSNKYRDCIYTNIYSKQTEMIFKIKEFCYHINIYRNSESNNLEVIKAKLKEIQSIIFETNEDKWNGMIRFNVYIKYYENIGFELEKFRCKMSGCKQEKPERKLVKSITKKDEIKIHK